MLSKVSEYFLRRGKAPNLQRVPKTLLGRFSKRTGQFVFQSSKIPTMAVPDLTDFKLKPYVARNTTRINKRTETTPYIPFFVQFSAILPHLLVKLKKSKHNSNKPTQQEPANNSSAVDLPNKTSRKRKQLSTEVQTSNKKQKKTPSPPTPVQSSSSSASSSASSSTSQQQVENIQPTFSFKDFLKKKQHSKSNKKIEVPTNLEEETDQDMSENRHHNLLEALLQNIGGSLLGSSHARLSNDKIESFIAALKDDEDEEAQLTAVSELCEYFSIASEHTLASSKLDVLVPELVNLLNKEHNYDLMILSSRALTHLMDGVPSTCSYVINAGAVPIFAQKLMNLEFIDLAEQSVKCLEPLSQQYGQVLLKEGILVALFSIVDFFAINLQRTILSIAYNIMKRINGNLFDMVNGIMPDLQRFLQYDDKTIVDYASQAISKVITRYMLEPDHLEKICTLELIEKLLAILNNFANASDKALLAALVSLSSAARGSFKVFEMMHEKTTVLETLDDILLSISSKHTAQVTASPSVGNNSRDQITGEVMLLMMELIPRTPIAHQFVTEMNQHRKRDLLTMMCIPEEYKENLNLPTYSHSTTLSSADSKKTEYFKKNSSIIVKLGETSLSILLQINSQNHHTSVKHRSLTIIGQILYISTSDILKEVLFDIPFSTFLTTLLSSKDLTVVSTAFQFCDILMTKLPDIFSIYFVREGVTNEIVKVSGRKPGSKAEVLVDVMKKRLAKAIEKAKNKKETSPDLEKKSENTDEKANEEESDDEELPQSSSTTTSSKMNLPKVQAPNILSTSSLSPSKIDRNCFSSSELLEYVVAQAQQIQLKYFEEGAKSNKNISPIVSNLEKIGKELIEFIENPDEDDEEKLLERLKRTLFGEQGVSNFEILNSGIIGYLLKYICEMNDSTEDRFRRVSSFVKVFSESTEHDRNSGMIGKLSSSPFTGSPLSSSPARRNMMHSATTPTTYMQELVRKFQSCFSSVENLELIVYDTPYYANFVSIINTLTKPFKVKIVNRKPNTSKGSKKIKEENEKKQSDLIIQVSPTASISTIIDFIKNKAHSYRRRNDEEVEDEEDDETHERIDSGTASYFNVTEDDEDEFSQSSITTVPEFSKESERMKYLNEVKLNKPNDSTGKKFKLYLNNEKEINVKSTLLQVLYEAKNESKALKHPAVLGLWDSIQSIYYEEVESLDSETISNTPVHVPVGTKPDITKIIINDVLDFTFDSSYEDVEKDALDALKLLHIISVLTANVRNIHSSKVKFSENLVPHFEFRNPNLMSKLQRQIHDYMIVFSGCLPKWVQDICTVQKEMVSFETRRELFELTSFGLARGMLKLQEKHKFGTDKLIRIDKQKIKVQRDSILQSMVYVMQNYGDSRAILEFEYEGEVGVGTGPTNEFYSLVSQLFHDKEFNIWKSEESTSQLVKAVKGLYPRPISDKTDSSIIEKLFYFMGKFVARSLFDNRLIDLPLNIVFLQLVKGEKVTMVDLQYVDDSLYLHLEKMLQLCQKRQEILDDESIKNKKELLADLKYDNTTAIEELSLDFTLPGHSDIELKPNGSNILVNLDNLKEYVSLIVEYYLEKGVRKQVNAFVQGFDSIIPVKNLSVFTATELESIICGAHEKWTEQLLLEATKCDHGFSQSSKVVKFLFRILCEFTDEQQKSFLKFVTGSPRLPFGGIKNLQPPLTIVRKIVEGSADSFLPSVMTCTNYLKLPEYSSFEVTKQQILKAIEEGQNSFLLS